MFSRKYGSTYITCGIRVLKKVKRGYRKSISCKNLSTKIKYLVFNATLILIMFCLIYLVSKVHFYDIKRHTIT